MHAFDFTQVGSKVTIRLAELGETLELLDGKVVNLTTQTLVIADAENNPIAIAGVMGGLGSSVTNDTQDVILESAFFVPERIAGMAKFYGVISDAAYRYERGVDYLLQMEALDRASSLITEICGGKVGVVTQIKQQLPEILPITVPYSAINKLLGIVIEPSTIHDILTGLGFVIVDITPTAFTVQVPSFRFDVRIKEDVIEEVARIYGYDKIEPCMPVVAHNVLAMDTHYERISWLKDRLVSYGYNEIIAYAFHELEVEKLLGKSEVTPLRLQNAIAGLEVLRTNLWPDLLKSLIYNVNRGCGVVRLFELARVFYAEDENSQPLKLSGVCYGKNMKLSWANSKAEMDFYDVKHDIELLLDGILEITFVADASYREFHPGRLAKIYHQGKEIGILGQLHPQLMQEFGLSSAPYLFELDINSLLEIDNCVKIQTVSKFPKVTRDLAFILHDAVAVGELMSAVYALNVPYLIEARVFDVYQGGVVATGFKSVAVNFVFQGNKTLVEDEISGAIQIIKQMLLTVYEAQLR